MDALKKSVFQLSTPVTIFKHASRVQDIPSPPKSLATSYTTSHMAAPHLAKPLCHAATFSSSNKKIQPKMSQSNSAQVSMNSDPSSKSSVDYGTNTSSTATPLQNETEAAEAMDIGRFI